jgi:hypothetical protein
MKTQKEPKPRYINIIKPQAILEAVKLGKAQAISEFKEKLKKILCDYPKDKICKHKDCNCRTIEKTAQEIK